MERKAPRLLNVIRKALLRLNETQSARLLNRTQSALALNVKGPKKDAR